MPVELIRISHEEYKSGKYAYASHKAGEDGGYFAKVFTDKDGNIEKGSYSSSYQKSLEEKEKKEKKEMKTSSSNSENKDGCLMKIIKAPFKFLWWILKQILGVLTLGLISSWLNGDNK